MSACTVTFPTTVSPARTPLWIAVAMAAAAIIGLAAGAAWPIDLVQAQGSSLYASAKVPG